MKFSILIFVVIFTELCANETQNNIFTIFNVQCGSYRIFLKLEKILKEINKEVGVRFKWINVKDSMTIAVPKLREDNFKDRLEHVNLCRYKIISKQWNDTNTPGNLMQRDYIGTITHLWDHHPIYNRVVYKILDYYGKWLSILKTIHPVTGYNIIDYASPLDLEVISSDWYFIVTEGKDIHCDEFNVLGRDSCRSHKVIIQSTNTEYAQYKLIPAKIAHHVHEHNYTDFEFGNVNSSEKGHILYIHGTDMFSFAFALVNNSLDVRIVENRKLQFSNGNVSFVFRNISSDNYSKFLLPRAVLENYSPTSYKIYVDYQNDPSIYPPEPNPPLPPEYMSGEYFRDLYELLSLDKISGIFPLVKRDFSKLYIKKPLVVERNSNCTLNQGSISYFSIGLFYLEFEFLAYATYFNENNTTTSVILDQDHEKILHYFPNSPILYFSDNNYTYYHGPFSGNAKELTFSHEEIMCKPFEVTP